MRGESGTKKKLREMYLKFSSPAADVEIDTIV